MTLLPKIHRTNSGKAKNPIKNDVISKKKKCSLRRKKKRQSQRLSRTKRKHEQKDGWPEIDGSAECGSSIRKKNSPRLFKEKHEKIHSMTGKKTWRKKWARKRQTEFGWIWEPQHGLVSLDCSLRVGFTDCCHHTCVATAPICTAAKKKGSELKTRYV